MMMRRGVCGIGIALAMCAGLAVGAPVAGGQVNAAEGQHERMRYDNHLVVQVAPRTQRELDRVLELAETIHCERVGLGPFEIVIHESRLAALEAMGLTPRVVMDDLQEQIDAERAEIEARRHQLPRMATAPGDATAFQNYMDLAGIEAHMGMLASVRSDLASLSVVGQSIQGRDLTAITITGPDTAQNPRSERPIVLLQGGQHAREWISPATTLYLADRLLADYDTDVNVRSLVDTIEFWIIPVLNPDGYEYTWNSVRLWRKNRRNNGGGDYGVDLNRNWGGSWWGGTGSSGFPGSDTYRGTAPFSEPETAAVRDLMIGFGDRLKSHIDYHSFSQLVLWPWGYTVAAPPAADDAFFTNLGTAMSNAMVSAGGVFYDPIQSADLYEAAGDATDYTYGVLGKTSFTIEMRDTGSFGFTLPADQILPNAQENWVAALLYADRTTRPISVSIDQLPSVPAGQNATVRVDALNAAETVDPASVTLFASVNGGAYQEIAMVGVGGGAYEAQLPAAACGDIVSYYATAESTSGSTVKAPSCGATCAIEAEAIGIVLGFADDMETASGWTVGSPTDTATTGLWERANPSGTAAQPEDDASASGSMCYVTDGRGGSVGQYDIDGGSTTLTSPLMDATAEASEAWITYARWYSNDQGSNPNTDSMPIEISNDDGASWVQVELVTENADRWVHVEARIADFVTPTDQMRIRFIARDENPGSIVEAGVDDVQIQFRGCEQAGPTADLNGDGAFNNTDINLFINLFIANDPAADFNGDGAFNNTDINLFINLFVTQM